MVLTSGASAEVGRDHITQGRKLGLLPKDVGNNLQTRNRKIAFFYPEFLSLVAPNYQNFYEVPNAYL